MFERRPELAKTLFWSAVCEAAIIGEHLIDTARRSAYQRVSHLLLELFVRLRTAGMCFNMPLTQELIGDALGPTTVHVNRTLRSLRADGLISINNRQVAILDFDALSLLCDFDNSYLGKPPARCAANCRRRGRSGKRPDPSSADRMASALNPDQ